MQPPEDDASPSRGQHPDVNDDQAMSSRPGGTGDRPARGDSILRATLFADAVVFLSAALFNFGAQLTIGSADLSFPNPVWQAGIGEAVIGLALLAAAFRPYGRGSWVAFWVSVVGIAFGLSSSRVQGPAREVHLVLVPLAILIFGLLIWRRQYGHHLPGSAVGSPGDGPLGGSPESRRTAWRPIPEAVIAVVLGISTAMIVLGQAKRWATALGATVFAILLTAYGLSVTLASSRTGDITYHTFVLALLLVIMVFLLLPAGRRSLTRP